MRVGIVGAGICGLSAGRALRAKGHEGVIFEKSRGPGGRVATRRKEGFVWDTGATSFAPRGKAIEGVMTESLDTTDLVRVEGEVYTHSNLRIAPGDPKRHSPRYAYRRGNTQLAKLLAEGLDLRTETTVDAIEREGGGYRIAGETFDALILTPPIPQTANLLWMIGESRPFAAVRYRSCLSVSLGYRDAALPETPYHALIAQGDHPLGWLSLESRKSPGRAPEGGSALGAQMSPAWSVANYSRPDAEVVAEVVAYVAELFGPAFAHPTVSDVMRWKYSQPSAYAPLEAVNPSGSRLLVASDSLLGGHVEDAYEVGQRVAALLP